MLVENRPKFGGQFESGAAGGRAAKGNDELPHQLGVGPAGAVSRHNTNEPVIIAERFHKTPEQAGLARTVGASDHRQSKRTAEWGREPIADFAEHCHLWVEFYENPRFWIPRKRIIEETDGLIDCGNRV